MPATTPIAETYDDVQNLMFKCCHKFRKSFGGDFDDLLSIANEVYMESYEKFEYGAGATFGSYLWTNIWRRLQDNYQYEQRRKMVPLDAKSASGTSYADLVEDRPHREFSLADFADGLSEDAMTVIKLIIETPEDLARMATEKGGTPRNWRSSVREWLASAGWGSEKIADSFDEISGILGVA